MNTFYNKGKNKKAHVSSICKSYRINDIRQSHTSMITKPKTETCIAINIHSIVSFFLAWFHGLIFYIMFSLLSLWEKGERARKKEKWKMKKKRNWIVHDITYTSDTGMAFFFLQKTVGKSCKLIIEKQKLSQIRL